MVEESLFPSLDGRLKKWIGGSLMRLIVKHMLGLILVAAIFPSMVRGQDSLCVHFNSLRGGVHLELVDDYYINGVLPLTICDLRPGDSWRLFMGGMGLESRTGYLDMDDVGQGSIRGSRISTAFRNMFLPGWGNIRSGRNASGWTDMGTTVCAGYYYLVEQMEYQDMKDSFDFLNEKLEKAGTYDERVRITEALHVSSRAINVQNTHRKRALILVSALYGAQMLLDPILLGNPPSWDLDAGGTILIADTTPRSRIKAFIYSTIWPGRGQFYQGKSTRGVAFSALSLVAGLYSLDRINSYDEYASLYETEVDRYNNAVSPLDRDYFRDRAARLWEDVDEVKKERDTALLILGGIWGLNLIDTFFPLDKYIPSSTASLEIDPGGMALVIQF